MRIIRFVLSTLVLASVSPASCGAHFLWIAAGEQTKDGKVHVYFSESATPDDPDLLDKVSPLKLWQQSKDGTATMLEAKKGADSLAAEPREGQNPVFYLSHDYGVISRGSDTFLLRYHAKCQPSADSQTWRAISNSEKLPLEIVPRADGDRTSLTIFWKDRPLPDSMVTVTGPGIEKKLEATSDAKGAVSFTLKSAGLFSIRAKYSEATEGESDGKVFSSIRHYATLTLMMSGTPLTTASTIDSVSALPPLDPGITSFGAAIVSDDLYIYGGHLGTPHHYSTQGQSNQLLRLNLKQPGQWDVISTGPKRTGLAAVAYSGKFYRIGGFEARNHDADKQSLWSMPDFARFDPKLNQWEQLTSMPAGRSSHDALIIGDTLYVVGGWELRGEGTANWHDTAYSVDLSAAKLEWKVLPKQPFLRRALSLGEWQGKVYAIGGMQSEGGITTATAIFDPMTRTWSEGPKLNGESMEGFGTSAFLCADKLCVTTFAGNIQMLSEDGSHWVNSGKLTYPRFFHRMLPVNASTAVIVGGASMQAGKIRELETISILASKAED